MYSACWMWLHTTIIFENVWFYSSVCSTLYHTNYKLLMTSNWVNSLDPFFLLQQCWVTPDLRCEKHLWILGFSEMSIKIWKVGAFLPSHLSGPPRKQNGHSDLWLVDFDPFECVSVFQSSLHSVVCLWKVQ